MLFCDNISMKAPPTAAKEHTTEGMMTMLRLMRTLFTLLVLRTLSAVRRLLRR